MILAVLGTHTQPMNRLVQMLDTMQASGALKETVVIQTAASHSDIRHLTVHPILPHTELTRLIASADVVISHAGPGSLAAIRLAGKVAVVVPRSPAYGEHVDNHQELYAKRLADLPGYIVVNDVSNLPGAIELARVARVNPTHTDVRHAVSVLQAELERARCHP